MLVSQFHNKNQFLLDLGDKIVLQSYESVVCIWDYAEHKLTLGYDWDYSNTTRKHVYMFIDEYCNNEVREVLFTNNKRKAVLKAINQGLIDCENYTILDSIIRG